MAAAQYVPEALGKLVTCMRSTDEVVAMKAALEIIDRGYGRATLALAPAPPPPELPNFGFDVSFEDGAPGGYGIETSDEAAARIYQQIIHGQIDDVAGGEALQRLAAQPSVTNKAPADATPEAPTPQPEVSVAPTPPGAVTEAVPETQPAPPPRTTLVDKPRVVEVRPEEVLPRVLTSEESERALLANISRTRAMEAEAKKAEQAAAVERENERQREQAAERARRLSEVRW